MKSETFPCHILFCFVQTFSLFFFFHIPLFFFYFIHPLLLFHEVNWGGGYFSISIRETDYCSFSCNCYCCHCCFTCYFCCCCDSILVCEKSCWAESKRVSTLDSLLPHQLPVIAGLAGLVVPMLLSFDVLSSDVSFRPGYIFAKSPQWDFLPC